MSDKTFRQSTSKPTIPVGNNVVVSCSHFDIPKEEGGVLVGVNGTRLMSGLCSTCWAAIIEQLGKYATLEAERDAAIATTALLTGALTEAAMLFECWMAEDEPKKATDAWLEGQYEGAELSAAVQRYMAENQALREALQALGLDYDGDGWHYFACPTRHGFAECDKKCKDARAVLGPVEEAK